MITARDVVSSIQEILGRVPDPALIEYHVGLGFPDRAALDSYMRSTDEYQARINPVAADHDFWPAKARAAQQRKDRLRSFGPFARGILVESPFGRFIVDPEDASVGAVLLQNGIYHPHEIDEIARFLPSQATAMVIGAHLGAHVVALARRCRQVIAIEANPATFSLLQANLALNECMNVEAHNVAVAATHETIRFLLNRENSGGSKRLPVESKAYYTYDSPEEVLVDAVPGDAIVAGRIVDFILMDIEGSEYFALAGLQETLKQVGCMAMEFLPFAIKEVAGADIAAFADLIVPHFRTMHVPGGMVVEGPERIKQQMITFFQRGEVHDLLYFSK